MKKDFYRIYYLFNSEDSEISLEIYYKNKIVHKENILGDFDSENDIKLTCAEIAESNGFTPYLFDELDSFKKWGAIGGKTTGVKKQRGDSEYYRQLRKKALKKN